MIDLSTRFPPPHRSRSGFFPARRGLTLVELLVVIAVIGILMGLLLPAVQAAREAGRRAQCQSNLRQISLSVANYHDIFRRFPPGEFLGNSGVGKSSRAWSWLARLLPYIEQKPLYDTGRVGQTTLDQSSAVAVEVSLFLCPSDYSSQGPKTNAGNLNGFAVGQTNYKGVMGANWGADASQNTNNIGTDWPNPGTNGSADGLNNGDGVMFRSDIRLGRGFHNVTDGLSNTYLAGEDLPDKDSWCSWAYSTNAYSTCSIPLNVESKPGSNYDPQWWPNVQSFRSRHAGGGFFAHCDGAVQFVSDTIELSVYRASATIAGGEVSSQ